jgi:hypothetical protein
VELATGPLEQAPKALTTDVWGEFLQRVLVSTNPAADALEAAAPTAGSPLPQQISALELCGDLPAGQ